jgi:NitT/TauT family transport system substrate-binding protein
MKRYTAMLGWSLAFSLLLSAPPALAQDKTTVNFVLDWIVGGRHTGWFTALHKGYYAEEGLDVNISRGYGSSNGIQRVASGQSQVGFNDIASAILARAKDGVPVKAVAVSYAKHPSAIFTLKKYNIKTLKDLEGKTLIDSAGSTNVSLFPMLAKAAGIDAEKVKWVLVAPDAKMQTFKAGKGQGVLFYNMQLPMLEGATREEGGVDMIVFGDHLPLYSNGLLVTDAYLAKNPAVVRGFVKAAMKGWAYAFSHPDEAVALLRKDNPLLDAGVAKAEVLFVKELMESPEAKKHGLGYMDEAKMRETRDTTLRLFDVKKTVELKDLYTNDFLPKSN